MSVALVRRSECVPKKCGSALRDQEAVEISITDSGPGLAPEVMERLFQPFIYTKRP